MHINEHNLTHTHIHDLNVKIDEVKPEPTQMAEINLNVIGIAHDITNTGIESKDIKIKLDLSDDDDFVNSLSTIKETTEQQDASETCFETPKINTCEIREESLKPETVFFKTNDSLSSHADERNYKCEICTKYFTRKNNLSRHMIVHTGERNYKCKICSKCFTTKGALSIHTTIHTGERNHKCEICSKRFPRKYELSYHLMVHTGERNYKCEICGKCFTRKYELSFHMKVHNGETNNKCEICTKCFTRKSSLSKHIVIHTGRRNYKCETCRKCFTTKGNLSSHMKVHTGERNFKCGICTKGFKAKHNLLTHLTGHKDERKYECEICYESCNTKRRFSAHMKTHTGERNASFKCEKTHAEEEPLQVFPFDVQSIENEEKLEINSGTVKMEQSTATNFGDIDTEKSLEEKPASTDFFGVWPKFNTETIIKKEENANDN